MKKVININVGGIAFTIEEDAYAKLKNYLDRFEATIANKAEAKEVMEDIELRVAEIFRETIKVEYQVVDVKLVEKVIEQLGQPEGAPAEPTTEQQTKYYGRPTKRLYRNPDDKMVAGVCGGLSAYLGVDPAIMRIIALLGLISGVGVMVYIILWIAVPKAETIAEKLEMRGEPITAENIRDYYNKYR